MIDETRTFEEFGYTSDELTSGSHKKVIRICDGCREKSEIEYRNRHRNLCKSCRMKTEKYKQTLSIAKLGKKHSTETRKKMAESRVGKKHSPETLKKMSKAQSGKNHPMYGRRGKDNPNYNHGLTEEERINERNSFEHREWALNVKIRDNFICQKCEDGTGGNLVSHHILGYMIHEHARFDLNNGITLCENCHKQFHYLYSYKYFTAENYFTWMGSDD